MKFIILALLFALSAINLSAYEQILITKTSKKDNLKHIKQMLHAMHIKMYVKKSSTHYLVYSQKFSSKKSANKALKRAQRKFPHAHLSSQRKDVHKSENGFLVTAALGMQTTSGTPESTGAMSYDIGAGYLFRNNVFVTLNYLDTSTDIIKVTNVYSAVNYKYNLSKGFSLYGGGIFGYSTLSLIDVANSTSSSSLIYGVQGGGAYEFYPHISLYGGIQAISTSHLIEYQNASDNVEFGLITNIQLGMAYRF